MYSWYVHITNLNSWYVYIKNWFRDIMNSICDITNWIRDITKSIRDMYISRIQITPIANSGLNSKTVFHTAAVAQFYFPIGLDDPIFFRYQHIKYRQNNSIHGRDITISVLQKQTSAILKFFIRFRLWPHHRNLHVILHQATKFRPNWSTHCGNMTSYPFLKMAAATAKY